MALLKFRVHPEEEDSVYRDVVVKHSQTFKDLHNIILDAYGFDKKHQATFYRSNDDWKRGREITLEKYDRPYRVEPLIMEETKIAGEIFDTNQKFIYEYDFVKNWVFYVSLIAIIKEADKDRKYPAITRVEGTGPQQYTKNTVLGKQFIDIEERYDLGKDAEGFGEEGGISTDNDALADDDAE